MICQRCPDGCAQDEGEPCVESTTRRRARIEAAIAELESEGLISALLAAADLIRESRAKHGAGRWRTLWRSALRESTIRHLVAKETADPESGRPHAIHVAARGLIYAAHFLSGGDA